MLSPRAALAGLFSLAVLATAPAVAEAGTITVSKSPTAEAGIVVGGSSTRDDAEPLLDAWPLTTPIINCGDDCSETIASYQVCKPDGTFCRQLWPTVTLSATANSGNGWQFSHLTGCTPPATTPSTCSFSGQFSRTVVAHFTDTEDPKNNFQIGGLQRGTITLDAKPTDNWGIKSVTYVVDGDAKDATADAAWKLHLDTTKLGGDGTKTIQAVVVDKADRKVLSPAQQITVDNHAPALIVDSPAKDKTYGPGATQEYGFAVKDVGPAGLDSVRCRLDSESFRKCSGELERSDTLKTWTHGRHTWQVRAVDNAGNEAIESHGFDVDAVAPDALIDDGPPPAVPVGSPVAFAFHAADETATFDCRLYRVDGAVPAFGDCTGVKTHVAAGLAVGGYRFEVRATDPYGNVDATPAQREFFVGDSEPPVIVIHSAPADDSYGPGRQLEFGFTVSDGAGSGVKRVECRLDSEPEFRGCAGTDRVTVTAGGRHTWMVRAVDYADRERTETRSFTIDATAPESTITDGPSGPVAGTAVALTFAADDPQASFRCRVATLGAPAPDFGPCSGAATHTVSGLRSGAYRFEVLALDRLGNVEPLPAAREFTITVPPQRITSPISHEWLRFPKGGYVKPTLLRVSEVPAGGKVTVICRGGAHKGCAFKKRSLTGAKPNVAKKLDLLGRKFRKGAVLEIRVTAPDMIGKVLRFEFRGGRTPARTPLCIEPGAAQPVKC